MTRALALAAVLLSGAAWGQSGPLTWTQNNCPPGERAVGHTLEGWAICVEDVPHDGPDGPGVSRPHAPTGDPTLDHVLGECDGARWSVIEWGADGARTDSYTWLEPLRPLCLWAEGRWALKQGMPK